MKKKTSKVTNFIEGLHKHIVGNPQFRKNTSGRRLENSMSDEKEKIILKRCGQISMSTLSACRHNKAFKRDSRKSVASPLT